jgi:hypothetical protein
LTDLDEDKKELIRDALRSANLLSEAAATKLCDAVANTVTLWSAEKNDSMPVRKQHNHLKGIWELLHDPDPPIGQIKSRFRSLSYFTRYFLRRRASQLWPRVFKLGADCDPHPYIERMGQRQLIRRLPSLISEGGYIPEGNSEFEPTMLAITRGLNDGPVGGRPRGDDELRLITYLTFDWKFATGELPQRGRNTEKGFGELVRHVFSWTTELSPEWALRRYWELVPKEPEEPPQPS